MACVEEEGALQDLGVGKALERARLKSNLNKELAAITETMGSASIGKTEAADSIVETQVDVPEEAVEAMEAMAAAGAAKTEGATAEATATMATAAAATAAAAAAADCAGKAGGAKTLSPQNDELMEPITLDNISLSAGLATRSLVIVASEETPHSTSAACATLASKARRKKSVAAKAAKAEAAAAATPEELPRGWATATDPSSGKLYYYEIATRESQWELPKAAKAEAAEATAAAQLASDGSGGWPLSLHAWVERAFTACRSESERSMVERDMRARIQRANETSSLWQINWDVEALPKAAKAAAKAAASKAKAAAARQLVDPAQAILRAWPDIECPFDRLLAGIRASRLTQRRGASARKRCTVGFLDHHLPHDCRLEGGLWQQARQFPTEKEFWARWDPMAARGEVDGWMSEWSDFINRVLTYPRWHYDAPSEARGVPYNDIYHDDIEFELFEAGADRDSNSAALFEMGWREGLPTRKELLEHMLWRAEDAYAGHLLGHETDRGEWCRMCRCYCGGFKGASRCGFDSDDDDDGSACGDDVDIDADGSDDLPPDDMDGED